MRRVVLAKLTKLVFLSKLIARCGCSLMVEQKPSKLMTRVRFPSPAPD